MSQNNERPDVKVNFIEETFMVINMNTFEHPIYKAQSISGFGTGVGNCVEEAIWGARQQTETLLSIVSDLLIKIEQITKEQFIAKTDCNLFGLSSWESSSVQWINVTISLI